MSLKKIWKRITSALLCAAAVLSLATPVSATIADLEPVTADRQVSPVRYCPRADSTVIGNLEDGTTLKIMGQSGDYFQINCGSMTGYLAKDQVKVDHNGYYYVNSSGDLTLPCRSPQELETIQQTLVDSALEYVGTPYVYGGKSPRGFDCSGFVQYIYSLAGYDLNRTASQQLCSGLIVEENRLLPGDIVFFQGTSSESGISSHVGIYVGNGQFVHASSSRGIIVSNLDKDYYEEHFLCARRVILSCVADYSSVPTPSANRSSGPVDRSFFA